MIGALSALGLAIGREKIEDVAVSRSAMDSAGKLRSRFLEEMKNQFELESPLENTLCRHIQQAIYGRAFDLTRNEDFQAFLKAGGHGDNGCPRVCGIAAQVAAEELSRIS